MFQTCPRYDDSPIEPAKMVRASPDPNGDRQERVDERHEATGQHCGE
jgi:hypothetical protein